MRWSAATLALIGLGWISPAEGGASDVSERKKKAAQTRSVLASLYPHSERITYFRVEPDAASRTAIEDRLGEPLSPTRWTFFKALTKERLDGYAWIGQAAGRGHHFSIALSLSKAGAIQKLVVYDYHSSRGKGVLRPEFAAQFVGRTATDNLRPGHGVDAVTGATISSNATINRVRAALLVFDQFVRADDRGEDE